MTKEEILNGMSEEEFYRLYPTREDWENSQQMKLGGLSGAPHNGQPTADQFFSYGSHANDKLNIPMSNPFYLAHGGTPYYGGPIRPYAYGGIPMAQSGYNLTPEEADYLKNNPLYEDEEYYVSDDNHDLKFVIGPNNTISNFQKRNPKWKEEKTDKYTNIPLEGENYEFAKKYLEKDIKDKYQQSLVEKLNRDVTSYIPSDSFKQYINTLNERKKKGETLDGYDDIYHYMIDNTQGQPLSKHMIENYQGYHPAALAKYLQKEYFVDKKYGGYMDMGGNMASPTNYGAFNVPMEYGGYEEYGGVLDPSNNQDYPMLETGGRSTLQNIIKAASKKLKKEYGGDTVMQGGNSDNYPQNITNNFKNAIKRNMYNSMINEEEKAASEAVMQMGGYPGGMYYNQGPQLNPQNQMLQSMYQQRIDDTQANLRNDFGNFLGASDYLNYTANPYSKTTVKAQDGIQVLLNKQTGKPFTSEEYNEYQKYFGKGINEQSASTTNQTKGDNYYYGSDQGMNYFPMNYNPYARMSRQNIALMQQLAANPSTNLKEFKHRGFGPWSSTKMTFGYKDQIPSLGKNENIKDYTYTPGVYTEQTDIPTNITSNIKNTTQSNDPYADYQYNPYRPYIQDPRNTESWFSKFKTVMQDKLHKNKGPEEDWQKESWINRYKGKRAGLREERDRAKRLEKEDKKIGLFGYQDPDENVMSYGGLFKAQYGRDHKSTNPADGLYDMNGNLIETTGGNMGLSSNPISMGNSFQPIGNAPGAAPSFTSFSPAVPAATNNQTSTNPTSFYSGWNYAGANTTTPTPQSAGLAQNNITMTGVQAPKVVPEQTLMGPEKQATITTKQRPGFSGEAMANWGIAGINTLAGLFEQRQNAKNEEKLEELQLADNAFVSTPGSALSQGDYDPNSGMFRPNKMVPVQFPGYSGYNPYTGFGAYGGSFQDGGMYEEGEELDLSPEEIEELRAQGYDIEYLD